MKKRFAIAALAMVAFVQTQSVSAQSSAAPGTKKGLAGLFASASEDELIEPDLAFQLKVAPKGPNTLVAELVPANGYYLYKEKIRFSAAAHWHDLPRQAVTRLSVRLRWLER